MNHEKLEKKKESRIKSIDVKFHSMEISKALEVYYWTGDNFHYYKAISHIESLITETARMQEIHDKEVENG